MASFYEKYAKSIPKSIEMLRRAQDVTLGGVGSSLRYWAPSPFFVDKAKGAYIWDLDGNKYIDYSMCYAAMIAGHANPIIGKAVKKQTDKGTLYGCPTEIVIELAEEIRRRYPVLEMIRFTQSGV